MGMCGYMTSFSKSKTIRNDIEKEFIMGVDLTQLWELVQQFSKTVASASGAGLKSAGQAVRKKSMHRETRTKVKLSRLPTWMVWVSCRVLLITELSMHLAGESEPLKVWQELRSCSPSTALANKVSGHVIDNIRELPAERGALNQPSKPKRTCLLLHFHLPNFTHNVSCISH